jgi:hypothetical protein
VAVFDHPEKIRVYLWCVKVLLRVSVKGTSTTKPMELGESLEAQRKYVEKDKK